MLASFTQVTAAGTGAGSIHWTQLLTAWERGRALSLTEEGQVVLLVQHLNLTELHMEHGSQRRRLLEIGNRHGNSESLYTERQQFSQALDAASGTVGEQAVVGLYLDRLLSWPSVQALLKTKQNRGGDGKPILATSQAALVALALAIHEDESE